MTSGTNTHKTLNDLFDTSCREYATRPCLSMAMEEPLTYGDIEKKVQAMSSALYASGVKKKDKIAILAENSPNWGIAYLSLIRLGATVVPILPDFTGTDVRHILTNSKVEIVFTTKRQIDKILDLQNHKIEKIITLDDSKPHSELSSLTTLSDFLSQSEQLPEKKRAKLHALTQEIDENDLASIIYTSGTSGHSKAVMLSHRNLLSNVQAAAQLVNITPEWTFLSILPMSHTYEFTIGFLLPLYNGCRITYAGKSPTPRILEQICKHEKPTAMCIVPMVMEKIYKKRVMTAVEHSTLLTMAVKVNFLRQILFQKIGKKLLDFFGGNLELLAIGGAAINIDTEKFLREAKFPYIIGYGLTETSPLLAGGPLNDPTIELGSTGKPVPGVEIRITSPDPETGIGAIMARGPNIMQGYYNMPEATAETIDKDGWLATGDLGNFDPQGNLHIKGRSKSVIVLAHGENIYPEAIEEKINCNMYVMESLVMENNERLEARIYLDYDLIDQETKGKSNEKQKEFINKILLEIQQTVNSQLPTYSKVHTFIERQEPFIKTATHKIKRYLYTSRSEV
ncbi:MAG: AMP-binding protein [Desulfobulbaceae bacterium]|uniref:AMP-binding protein n=1 Tax=Candidatus Desulfobia pelagia TaxID=2841692 RepID=A0A8J6TBV4_9BACT|nr:AMP-binding protein [Candidatus Desulfobia pelagia]